jgi:CubicO group peptidase (beta-lactamase class C family)
MMQHEPAEVETMSIDTLEPPPVHRIGHPFMPTRRAAMAGLAMSAMAPCGLAVAKDNPLGGAMSGTDVPGMATLVIRGFRAQQESVAGIRRMGAPASVRRGDRWHLGSNGKAMTATLIARLVEAGSLSWDARLDQLLPQFSDSMHPDYRDVKLPDLLSHRAGLPENHEDIEFFLSFYEDRSPLTQQRLRYIATAMTAAPVAEKRGARSYSNTGYLIAAAAAKRATGRDFESLILEEVFSPLHMRSISFSQLGGAREPVGHVDRRVADQQYDANPPMFAPAGGMRMTLRDWSRFCIDQLQGEHGRGRLLRAELYRFLHAPQGETRTALGWGAQPDAMGRRGPALTHSGSDGNWNALVLLFPETGNGVLVAANAGDSMGGDAASVAALRELAAGAAEPQASAAP